MKNIVFLLMTLFTCNQLQAQHLLEALESDHQQVNSSEDWSFDIQAIRYLVSVYDRHYSPMSTHNFYKDQPTQEGQYGSMPPRNIENLPSPAVRDEAINYIGKITPPVSLQRNEEITNYPIAIYTKSEKLPKILGIGELSPESVLNKPSSRQVAIMLPGEPDENGMVKVNKTPNSANYPFTDEVYAYLVSQEYIELTPLDINMGIGQTGMGVNIANIQVITSNSGTKNYVSINVLPAIPGPPKMVKGRYPNDIPQYFGLPIVSYDGRTYLSNALGANYMNLAHPRFNPVRKYSHPFDIDGMGKTYNWQRNNLDAYYDNPFTPYVHMKSPTFYGMSTEWEPDNDIFYTGQVRSQGADWHKSISEGTYKDTWGQRENNPICPQGYYVPTFSEIQNLQKQLLVEDFSNSDIDYKSNIANTNRIPLSNSDALRGFVFAPTIWANLMESSYIDLVVHSSDTGIKQYLNGNYYKAWTHYFGADLSYLGYNANLSYNDYGGYRDVFYSDRFKNFLRWDHSITSGSAKHAILKGGYDEMLKSLKKTDTYFPIPYLVNRGLEFRTNESYSYSSVFDLHPSMYPTTICIRNH